MSRKCISCVHGKLLYYTDDKTEIQKIREKQIVKKLKLFCEVSKKLAKEKPEKLARYVKSVNPFDVSYEDWNEGFLREPKTETEKKEANLYCLVEPFEPNEVSELDKIDIDECSEYKKYFIEVEQNER